MSHTPGPWFIVKGETSEELDIQTHPKKNVGCFIVGTAWGGLDDSGMEANAKLIAAAPELLNELKHLVRLLTPEVDAGQLSVPGLATLNGANAAIAKAEGR